MNYEQCLIYLDQIQNLGIKFGLDNVRTILSSLNDPQNQYPAIHIAGTNGKGSVCAILSQILMEHGHRPGLFTSPHLVTVRERIRIAGDPIPEEDFSRHLSRLREVVEELIVSKALLSPPTYFEMLSCLAFLHFAEERVDMAVLEVGMGGRYDATNVVTPVVSAITTISPEHQKFLGETQSEIASEKAGIIKPGIPLVCGVEETVAHTTIRNRAEELNAPFFAVFSDSRRLHKEKTEQNFRFEYTCGEEKYNYLPSLLGEHQGKNAAIAIAVARQLSKDWRRLDQSRIIRGIETAKWPGRLEIVSERPLVLVDGAHNVEGAKALRKYVQEFISLPCVLVFAVMRDKNIQKLSEILFPLAHTVICTRFPYFKAASPEDIQRQASRFHGRIVFQPDVPEAAQAALQAASPDGVVLVAGSLFLVGEIKKIFDSAKE
ncbi:MAG: folylpolyglutamate synthase/dihydrofolate synthase family protein [Candidatus Aminicenantaceae bacterium]|jgi:dihydrofolate synthase/folylpolyglutamate synthase